MACDLTRGRLEPCKDSVGGLKAVYFVDYGDMTLTEAGGTVSSIGSSVNAYKYDLKGNSSFTQNIQSSRETGTTAFEQVLELTLKGLTSADHQEIKLLSYGRPHVIVEDYNGNYFLAGKEHGMDVTGGTVVTGAAMNELSGYTLTFTGMEKSPAEFLDSDVATAGGNVIAGS
jgi:hypothetical protein